MVLFMECMREVHFIFVDFNKIKEGVRCVKCAKCFIFYDDF